MGFMGGWNPLVLSLFYGQAIVNYGQALASPHVIIGRSCVCFLKVGVSEEPEGV